MKRTTASLPLVALLSACGGSSPATPDAASDATPDAAADVAKPRMRDVPAATLPVSVVAEAGVRRERMFVDVPAAPMNPSTRAATPREYDRVQVIRYRVDAPTPVPVRAVVVAVPGFLGGAGSFDPIARALVKRGAMASTPVEVWALDRRSNLLEDLRGMDAAEAMRDPEVAEAYYLSRTLTVGGRAFEGYRGANDPSLSYMAEWGLATLVNDLRAVVARVPDSRRHVVMLGHSLGASVVEAYAAWDFAGTPGSRTLAGLAMVDGVAGGTSVSETSYLMGGDGGPLGFMNPGIVRLRTNGPYFTALPFLGVKALVVSEVVARRAALAPDAVVADAERDALFRVLLSTTTIPPMSNAAALGFAFDDASCPLGFARMAVGAPVGPVRRVANPFSPMEMLAAPDSATATYRWTDAPAASPREFTPVANAAAAWATSPSNFGEWYFPSRLALDVAALGNLSLAADAWQVREGLRVTRGRDIDVPILGVSAGLVGTASAYDRVRARVAPALGADLPDAGATRAMPVAFRAIHVPRMTHLDPLTGADGNPDNPVPEAMFTFATRATAGTVAVPAQ